MWSQRNVFIFIDASSKMHVKIKKKTTTMDRVYKFLMTLAKKADAQPAYFHRLHLYIGDIEIKLEPGKAVESIQNARDTLFEPSQQTDQSSDWKTALNCDTAGDNQFFIISRGVGNKVLKSFEAYSKNLLFLDFSGWHQNFPRNLAEFRKSQVQVISGEDVVKSAKLIHRRLLSEHVTKVNMGFSMKTEFLTSSLYGKYDLDLERIDIIGTTTYEPAESIEIFSRGFILPVDAFYDRKKTKISNPFGYRILKELLGDDTPLDNIPEGTNSIGEKRKLEKGGDDPIPAKRATTEQAGTSEHKKKEEKPVENPSKWLIARGLDRITGIYRPVILRLRGLTQNDLTYYDEETLKKKLEEEAKRAPVPVKEEDSPASPDCPASPDLPPTTSTRPVKIIPTDMDYRMSVSVDTDHRSRGPKIIPLESGDPEDDDELGDLVDEDMGSADLTVKPLGDSQVDQDGGMKEKHLEEIEEGVKLVEVVVLNMPWDQFVFQAATMNDDETFEEITERERTVVGEEPFFDYTKLTGWFTEESMQFHLNKVFRALRKIGDRKTLFEAEHQSLTEMVTYGQNPDLARTFALLMVDDLKSYPDEATPIAQEASKHFEKLYHQLEPYKPKKSIRETKPGEPQPAQRPRQDYDWNQIHQPRRGYQGQDRLRGGGYQGYQSRQGASRAFGRDPGPPRDQGYFRDQGYQRDQGYPREQAYSRHPGPSRDPRQSRWQGTQQDNYQQYRRY